MNLLFKKADISVMSPITQKLDALLKAEGFLALVFRRMENSGFSHNINVNQIEYIRGKHE